MFGSIATFSIRSRLFKNMIIANDISLIKHPKLLWSFIAETKQDNMKWIRTKSEYKNVNKKHNKNCIEWKTQHIYWLYLSNPIIEEHILHEEFSIYCMPSQYYLCPIYSPEKKEAVLYLLLFINTCSLLKMAFFCSFRC